MHVKKCVVCRGSRSCRLVNKFAGINPRCLWGVGSATNATLVSPRVFVIQDSKTEKQWGKRTGVSVMGVQSDLASAQLNKHLTFHTLESQTIETLYIRLFLLYSDKACSITTSIIETVCHIVCLTGECPFPPVPLLVVTSRLKIVSYEYYGPLCILCMICDS